MKKKKSACFITRVLTLILLLSMMLPSISVAEAKYCSHKYSGTDVCRKCGDLRVHEFDYSITFYTAKKNVPVWDNPTKNSTKVETISKKDKPVEIEGLLRNQYGNLWLKVANENQYIFVDNLYLDFGTLVLQNYQKIHAWDDPAEKLTAFIDLVMPGGHADYKVWLDPGGKQIPYTVRMSENSYYTMTAEELGNIHYGFLARALGLDSDIILYSGGIVNQYGKLNWKFISNHYRKSTLYCGGLGSFVLSPTCIIQQGTRLLIADVYNECSNSYCDTSEDANGVASGIEYYDSGSFEWE